MSQLLQRTVPTTGTLIFNGTDQYATLSVWDAAGFPCGFGATLTVTTAILPSAQYPMAGPAQAGQGSSHRLQVNGSGLAQIIYRDAVGGTQIMALGTVVDGQTIKIEAKYFVDRVEAWVDGVLDSTNLNAPELPRMETIAASSSPSQYFGGSLLDVFMYSPDGSTDRVYPMNDGQGTVVRDSKHNGDTDGTLINVLSSDWITSYPVAFTTGTGLPAYFHNGLPYEEDGSLAITNSSGISHYHQGLSFVANGRLVTFTNGIPARFGGGSAPFNATERLLITDTPADHYSAGVAYNTDSAVSMGEAVVVNQFSSAFSSAFD